MRTSLACNFHRLLRSVTFSPSEGSFRDTYSKILCSGICLWAPVSEEIIKVQHLTFFLKKNSGSNFSRAAWDSHEKFNSLSNIWPT